jgi:hypothetical protein
MGIIGNLLADNASGIGSWIDKNIFGGSGKTGRSIGDASSNLLRLIPFENGGKVKPMKAKAKKGKGKKKM